MSMEDPFFVVKGEVQKAVNTSQGLYQRWTELLADPSSASKEECDWTTNELRNSLRSIEWDLEDLDETISIVETNPRKFNLDPVELSKRKAFITNTKQIVKEMKDHMSSSSMQALVEQRNRQTLLSTRGNQGLNSTSDKYSRLDQELQAANLQFIEDQHMQQQLITEQQDDQLELVSGSIGVLKNMSQKIGNELDEQAVSASVVWNCHPTYHLGRGADIIVHSLSRNCLCWRGRMEERTQKAKQENSPVLCGACFPWVGLVVRCFSSKHVLLTRPLTLLFAELLFYSSHSFAKNAEMKKQVSPSPPPPPPPPPKTLTCNSEGRRSIVGYFPKSLLYKYSIFF
ncbi:syntaxin-6 isoform X1 [Hemiscyllium ocellatum]|uniref:syntaxin-6 isoform X1 n=1 Tax=Hemiscyllium ocellatum TaxID=170820 RepID=UPI002966AF4B|nr:syntaxin-6 isoform X1 [Hemiscyllium ocellatum]